MEENEIDDNGSYTPLSINGLALTEYTANPSPPRRGSTDTVRSVVPPEFMLPNGYPDV
jgi:threonine dehydratase